MLLPQDFFTALSDITRLRCLVLLHQQKEICVCEFSQLLDSIQPKISRHLSWLRRAGLVVDERRGQWVYYRLNEKGEPWMKELLKTTAKKLASQGPFLEDSLRLKELGKSNPCCN